MNILSVNGISKSYKKEVLRDLSFDIGKGEVVGLLGPEGCGKTTLMRIISLLTHADCGDLKVCNIDGRVKRKNYLKNISYITDVPALYENLRGYDNINFIRKINQISKENMADILEFIELGDKINDRVENYSLYMKQKLALGIALLKSPKLLIWDQPNSNLNIESSEKLKELLIRTWKTYNMAILISSNRLSYIQDICHRILFLRDGEIVSNSIDDIKLRSQNMILTIKNPIKEIDSIKTIRGINSVEVYQPNRVCINVMKDNTAYLLQEITDRDVQYSKLEVITDIMENNQGVIYKC